MNSILDLKKKKRFINFGKKEIIVIILAVILTTVGIKASDNIFNSDGSETDSQCGENMVFISSSVGGFCIDKYEASAGDKCPVADPGTQADTRSNIDYPGCLPVTRAGAAPWRNISQNQAAQACVKAGKRLPTNKEWLSSAMGTPDTQSGWGSDDCQVANNWDNQPGLTGTGNKCVSSAGTYDMIGNVWEWVDGTVFEGAYGDKPLPDDGYILGVDEDALPSKTTIDGGDPDYYKDYFWIKNIGTRAMARGGYWDNKTDAGQYSLYVVFEPSFTGTGMGFRCVQ